MAKGAEVIDVRKRSQLESIQEPTATCIVFRGNAQRAAVAERGAIILQSTGEGCSTNKNPARGEDERAMYMRG